MKHSTNQSRTRLLNLSNKKLLNKKRPLMRTTLYLLFISFLLTSCGGDKAEQSVDKIIAEGNVENLKSKKAELKAEITALNAQVAQLDEVLKNNDKSKKEVLVTAQTVKDTIFRHFVEVQGNVETKQNVLIYPEYQGTLTRVYVKEGQRVSKGQTLGSIDDGGLGSQVAQLEAQSALAKTTYERQKRLWEQKIGSEIQFLQAQTQYESANSAVKQLKSQLGKTVIRAPFSGVIDDVITDQGTVVAPGQAVFRIVNLRDMFVSAEVPESYLASVVKGKSVAVNIPVLGKTIESKVRQTGNYINPANRSFKVEVGIPSKDGSIKPNLTARLSINDYTAEKAILIPLNVINEDSEGAQYVYTAEKNGEDAKQAIAKRRIIKTGKTQGGQIEVLEGLSSGEHIIVKGARSVKDNQEVRILNY